MRSRNLSGRMGAFVRHLQKTTAASFAGCFCDDECHELRNKLVLIKKGKTNEDC